MFQDILTKKIEERKREKDEEGEKRGFFSSSLHSILLLPK